jgi:hypothetical protein
MGSFYKPCSYGNRRAVDLFDSKQFQGQAASDNIHDRVDCSDFMKMDIFNVYTVDPGFNFTEPGKNRFCIFHHEFRKTAGFNKAGYGSQGAMAGVPGFCRAAGM